MKDWYELVEREIIGQTDNDTIKSIVAYMEKRVEDIEKQLKEEE